MLRPVVVWSAAVVGLSIVLFAVPMLLMDVSANDGAASMTALFAFPMIGTAVLIELQREAGSRTPTFARLWPWVLALVVGMVFTSIPAMLLEPRYFTSETQAGMLATLGLFAVIMAVGAASGFVLWGLVVLPIATLIGWLRLTWRGETVGRSSAALTLSGASLGAVAIVTLLVVVTAERPDELVFAQLGAILLGIPLGPLAYEPPPELAVGIVRLLLVGIVVVAVVLTVTWHARGGDRDQSQTR